MPRRDSDIDSVFVESFMVKTAVFVESFRVFVESFRVFVESFQSL